MPDWNRPRYSPVNAAIALVALTVVIAALVGTFILDLGQQRPVTIRVSADVGSLALNLMILGILISISSTLARIDENLRN